MDKFQKAVIDYERKRLEIKRLTKAIGDAAGGYDEEGSWINCADVRADGSQCVNRLWKARIDVKREQNEDGVTYQTAPEKQQEALEEMSDDIRLCPSCKEVDRLVQLRKKARRQFGVAKRRISALAKPLLNGKVG